MVNVAGGSGQIVWRRAFNAVAISKPATEVGELGCINSNQQQSLFVAGCGYINIQHTRSRGLRRLLGHGRPIVTAPLIPQFAINSWSDPRGTVGGRPLLNTIAL